jgi:hypothetical protein
MSLGELRRLVGGPIWRLADGHRQFALEGFQVERVLTREGGSGGSPILRACCHVCGMSFKWQHGVEEEAKRRRLTLPCGHWLFELAFMFDLELQDANDPSSKIVVTFCDKHGSLFNITPQQAAASTTQVDMVERLLGGLLIYEGNDNLLTGVVNESHSCKTLVACDAVISHPDVA